MKREKKNFHIIQSWNKKDHFSKNKPFKIFKAKVQNQWQNLLENK